MPRTESDYQMICAKAWIPCLPIEWANIVTVCWHFIPNSVRSTRAMTWNSIAPGLLHMVVINWWLDLVILLILSNLNDSMIFLCLSKFATAAEKFTQCVSCSGEPVFLNLCLLSAEQGRTSLRPHTCASDSLMRLCALWNVTQMLRI